MHKVFMKQSTMPGTAEQMMHFHELPDVFKLLTPPPSHIQVLRNDLTSLTYGELEFRLWVMFIPLHWLVRHEPGPLALSFIDRMLDGPMAFWEHQHIFQDVPNGVQLTDYLTIEHRPGLMGFFTRLVFDGLPLQFLFFYCHWVTRRALVKMQ